MWNRRHNTRAISDANTDNKEPRRSKRSRPTPKIVKDLEPTPLPKRVAPCSKGGKASGTNHHVKVSINFNNIVQFITWTTLQLSELTADVAKIQREVRKEIADVKKQTFDRPIVATATKTIPKEEQFEAAIGSISSHTAVLHAQAANLFAQRHFTEENHRTIMTKHYLDTIEMQAQQRKEALALQKHIERKQAQAIAHRNADRRAEENARYQRNVETRWADEDRRRQAFDAATRTRHELQLEKSAFAEERESNECRHTEELLRIRNKSELARLAFMGGRNAHTGEEEEYESPFDCC